MKLYVVRHGQTDWNKEQRVQGWTDVPLNEIGIRQAEELRDKIRDLELDVCYASPLIRAAKTAQIAVDGKCKIIYDDRLKERCFGKFEGMATKDYKWTGLIDVDRWDRRINTAEGGIEPVLDLIARAREFLERIKTENDAEARMLIVAHGGLLKVLHFVIVGYDDETDFWKFFLENGEVAEYEI